MKSTTPRDPALGQGFYSVEEAARLIHAKPRTVQRWLFGYEYKGQTAGVAVRRRSEGLWTPQYGAEEFSQKALGFLDLLELRVVRAFVNAGVPLLVVRHCLARARDLFGDDYPLTSQRFVTDGETVFWDSVATVNGAANRTEKAELLNLRNGQYTFRDIVQPSLFAGIEYRAGAARRWYPQYNSKMVVLDPAVQFGAPVIESAGVPTVSLYATYLAEGRDAPRVARLFELTPRQVGAAVQFEESLLEAA